jgi:Mg-chelatase subunit ChlD
MKNRPRSKAEAKLRRPTKRRRVLVQAVDKRHVLMILDCSGSMESCRAATVSGFNEQLASLRKGHRPDLTTISLTRFNHDVRFDFVGRHLINVPDLTLDEYQPGGNTAMYDAIGKTVQNTTDYEDTAYLVVILSDGMENASRVYTAHDVASALRIRQATGRWTIVYLGANQDLTKVAHELSIPLGNTAIYSSTPIGTHAAMAGTRGSTMSYMGARGMGVTASSDFFGTGGVSADFSTPPDTFAVPAPVDDISQWAPILTGGHSKPKTT